MGTLAALSVVVSLLSPQTGVGAGRMFTFVFENSNGAANIATAEGLIAKTESAVNGCYFYASDGQLWLRNDQDTAWHGPITPGTPQTMENSYCRIFAIGSSIAVDGDRLTLSIAVTFDSRFPGDKTIYARASERDGLSSGWVKSGTWTVAALDPRMDVITSSCADPSKDTQIDKVSTTYDDEGKIVMQSWYPPCFPYYTIGGRQEGYYLEDTVRPLPIMGRTCGHFNVLFVFVDTDVNRKKLLDSTFMPDSAKAKVLAGHPDDALTEYLQSFTPQMVMSGFHAPLAKTAVTFTFSVVTTQMTRRQMYEDDGGLGFVNFDAAVLVDDLSPVSGIGVRRWPWIVGQSSNPIFNGRAGSFFLELDPYWLSPGLFGNELLRRNVPLYLKEYELGKTTLTVINGVTYADYPVINPRTGEDIAHLTDARVGMIPTFEYIMGLGDVDGDGIVDCLDPEITPTPDNVDGDFIPDRFDPDLTYVHKPYSWMWAERGGVSIPKPKQ